MNLHRLHRLHHRQLVTLQTTNAAVRRRKTRQKGGKRGNNLPLLFQNCKAIAVTYRWFTFGSNPTITQKTQPSQQTDEERATDRHHPTVKTTKRQRTPNGHVSTTPLNDGSSSSSSSPACGTSNNPTPAMTTNMRDRQTVVLFGKLG